MRKDFEKLFSHLDPPEPPEGLFDRITLAIRREQELRQTRRSVYSLFILMSVSLTAAPFSWALLRDQVESSGILYFLSTMANDLGIALALWQDFGLAILESLPITGLIVFSVNIVLAIITVRLFLYKKGLLLAYILPTMNKAN